MKEITLIALFTCHWLADYTHLSTSWMLSAKSVGRPIIPILAHGLVHTLLMVITMVILEKTGVINITSNTAFYLAIFQCISHTLIDIWKGRMNVWFPSLRSPQNKFHWVVFGFDQLLHAIVIIIMVYLIHK